MKTLISEKARQRIVDIARDSGFLVQLKSDGSDNYVKNLMFKVRALKNPLYIRKDVATNATGEPEYMQIAVHPNEFRQDLVAPAHGINEMRNKRTGVNLFSSSNYRGFPHFPSNNEPCGKCYRVDDYPALAKLLQGISNAS